MPSSVAARLCGRAPSAAAALAGARGQRGSRIRRRCARPARLCGVGRAGTASGGIAGAGLELARHGLAVGGRLGAAARRARQARLARRAAGRLAAARHVDGGALRRQLGGRLAAIGIQHGGAAGRRVAELESGAGLGAEHGQRDIAAHLRVARQHHAHGVVGHLDQVAAVLHLGHHLGADGLADEVLQRPLEGGLAAVADGNAGASAISRLDRRDSSVQARQHGARLL
ncbi:hypothetical protein [Duganella sp. P38]|uniref:hypothetical protein n=1 Tax=Duganella sp. P38 TaxID=3423949 RepID=UPI003D7A1A6E